MSYQETLEYLYSQLPMYQRVGDSAFKKDLSNIIALASWLGNPQQSFKSIHIAGTNGKGSVAHMLASVLMECGLKVGVYTSPHYIDFRERIKVNGQYIDEEAVIGFCEKFINSGLEIKPSFFELTVAMAFEHFKNEEVDIAIIETGLGGRLDSTNIIEPEFSIITNISLDHQQYLGDDLLSIAAEKAGIIKINTPVIVGEYTRETREVFVAHARDNNSIISFTSDLFYAEIVSTDIDHSMANIYSFGQPVMEHIVLPLSAKYQWKNVLTVFHAVHLWNDKEETKITEKEFKTGLKNLIRNTSYIPRSKFSRNENILIGWDSAHNEAGVKVFIEEISSLTFNKLHVVLSAVKDKDLAPILKLFPADAFYYFCQADIPRALPAKQLKEQGENFNLKGNAYDSSSDAFDQALRNAANEDLIIICGSIFTIGELLAARRIG